jgi:hypothetical protein
MENEINLGRIADVNENIKQIVRTSDKVYMIALNAMFMSRKTKVGVSGFSAVTSELRSFSGKLNKHMSKLKIRIGLLVDQVARVSKLKKRRLLLEAAISRSGIHSHRKLNCIESDSLDLDLDIAVSQFLNELNKALTLIGVGQNLVVLAKVEANGAGELSHELTDIANSMDDTIVLIENLVRYGQQQLAA